MLKKYGNSKQDKEKYILYAGFPFNYYDTGELNAHQFHNLLQFLVTMEFNSNTSFTSFLTVQ